LIYARRLPTCPSSRATGRAKAGLPVIGSSRFLLEATGTPATGPHENAVGRCSKLHLVVRQLTAILTSLAHPQRVGTTRGLIPGGAP